jgi:hypothetical protein
MDSGEGDGNNNDDDNDEKKKTGEDCWEDREFVGKDESDTWSTSLFWSKRRKGCT